MKRPEARYLRKSCYLFKICNPARTQSKKPAELTTLERRHLLHSKISAPNNGILHARNKDAPLCLPQKIEWQVLINEISRLNCLRSGVEHFRSSLRNWNVATTVACECSLRNQTANRIATDFPFYSAPHGANELILLDNDTTSWLQETCPNI